MAQELDGDAAHWAAVEEATELLHEERFREAMVELGGVLKKDPKNPYAFYFLGIAFFEVGEIEPARDAYAACVKLSPGHLGARVALCHVLRIGGDIRGAIREGMEALARAPGIRTRCTLSASPTTRGATTYWRAGTSTPIWPPIRSSRWQSRRGRSWPPCPVVRRRRAARTTTSEPPKARRSGADYLDVRSEMGKLERGAQTQSLARHPEVIATQPGGHDRASARSRQ